MAYNSVLESPSCFMCNGFYGPNFNEPVCTTCHAFLFTPASFTNQLFGLNTDTDSDSGNDEPCDNSTYTTQPENNAKRKPNTNPVGTPSPVAADFRPISPVVPAREYSKECCNSLEVDENNLRNESNIENLPNEVLMHIVTYMDDITLWSFSQVNRRIRDIVLHCVSNEDWKYYTLNRWIFFRSPVKGINWFEVYTVLMKSSCCIKCIQLMAALNKPVGQGNPWHPWRERRLRTELRVLSLDPVDGIQAQPLDDSCYHWQACLDGPSGSPYEGGRFYLYIQVPYSYPLDPPIVRFITKIFHPNVSRHGDIGIDSIQHNWSLALTIGKVLISIQSLLTDPYCDVCMEPLVGKMYTNDRASFDNLARKWTWRYAIHDFRLH